MYQCLDCGLKFEEPRRYSYNHGDSPYHIEKWNGCPKCSGAYESMTETDRRTIELKLRKERMR